MNWIWSFCRPRVVFCMVSGGGRRWCGTGRCSGAGAEDAYMAADACDFVIDFAPWCERFIAKRPVTGKGRRITWRGHCSAWIGRMGGGLLLGCHRRQPECCAGAAQDCNSQLHVDPRWCCGRTSRPAQRLRTRRGRTGSTSAGIRPGAGAGAVRGCGLWRAETRGRLQRAELRVRRGCSRRAQRRTRGCSKCGRRPGRPVGCRPVADGLPDAHGCAPYCRHGCHVRARRAVSSACRCRALQTKRLPALA